MAGDREERSRVLGMPWGADPRASQEEEHQRILGFPADWFESPDRDWLASIAHPVRRYQRWMQRRRLGIYAPDEGDPEAKG